MFFIYFDFLLKKFANLDLSEKKKGVAKCYAETFFIL